MTKEYDTNAPLNQSSLPYTNQKKKKNLCMPFILRMRIICFQSPVPTAQQAQSTILMESTALGKDVILKNSPKLRSRSKKFTHTLLSPGLTTSKRIHHNMDLNNTFPTTNPVFKRTIWLDHLIAPSITFESNHFAV